MKDTEFLKKSGVDLDSALELLGDLSFYDETLIQFLEENKTRLPNIAKYRKENNMPEYAILVHALKSDAKYLGFTDLAEIAYAHEMASKANDINTVNQRYNELVNTYNKYARIAFEYLGQTSSGQNDESSQNKNDEPTNKRSKIIVADDSLIISGIVKKAFEDKYDVLIAVNGIEAINLIQSAVPEEIVALILDLNMPKADGFAVLDYLKENELSKRIPVCIITGDVEKEKIDRAFTYKVVDVIPKPFTIENVRNVIEKIKF